MIGIRQYSIIHRIAGVAIFVIALLLYASTMERDASWWDCPEYITIASGLQIGHPPGNPLWMLVGHIASILAPRPEYIALFVNATSVVFASLTVLLLYLSSSALLRRLIVKEAVKELPLYKVIVGIGASGAGALIFCVSDSIWFSAVEAEVYALSLFFVALMFWIALKWTEATSQSYKNRLLLLLAYLSGLTLGVHQLNLLALPALALIVAFHNRANFTRLQIAGLLIASLLIIAMLLFAMIPATLHIMQKMESLIVTNPSVPYHTGVIIWIVIAAIIAVITISIANKAKYNVVLCSVSLGMLLFVSGLLSFGGNLAVGLSLSILAAIAMIYLVKERRFFIVASWGITFVMLGASIYFIVPIRANANPPINTGVPDDIFSFAEYMERRQYGDNAPLLYGRTLNSTLVRDSSTKLPIVSQSTPKIRKRTDILPIGENDTSSNHMPYLTAGNYNKYMYTPELDMVFPRIHSGNPSHRAAYNAWAGMTEENMGKVVVNSGSDTLLMPTQKQNLRFFLGYQVGYMYLRYLMWNFSGRQNDVSGAGEIDAGNFLTGIPAIDNLMTTDSAAMPADISRDNPGHNRYFMLPLLLGLIGIIWLLKSGKRGRRQCLIIATLFVMTGVAIVVWLNQTPSEPRERDYSFLASYWAFTIWIAMGVAAVASWLSKFVRNKSVSASIAVSLSLLIAIWMGIENYHDHDRSARTATMDFAWDTLQSCPQGALLIAEGDNYVFPLQYAQNVLNIRPDVTVINEAYLSSQWYINQLHIEDFENEIASNAHVGKHRGVRLHLSRFDYGEPSEVTYYPTASTDTIDATEALLEIEKTLAENIMAKDKSRVIFPARYVKLSPMPRQSDSLVIDLRKVAKGKHYLLRQELALLDILASNARSGWRRPVCLTLNVRHNKAMGLDSLFHPYASIRMLQGSDTARQSHVSPISPIFRYGSIDRSPDVYLDPVSRRVLRQQRQSLALQAYDALQRGDTINALAMAEYIERKMPESVLPYRAAFLRENVVNEGRILGQIYETIGYARANSVMASKGIKMQRLQEETGREYYEWYSRLPRARRQAITNASMAIIKDYISNSQ